MLVSALILLVLMMCGGTIYIYIMDKGTGSKIETLPAANIATDDQPIKPMQPSVNAPEGAAIQMLSSPVAPGSDASVSVQTNPGSTCTIVVAYSKSNSTAAGLIAATADAFGSVNWDWTVDANAPLGTWPVKITCTYHSHVGFVQGDLQITKTGQ
jgi:hypothetical protein